MSRFSICIPFTLLMECPYPNDWPNPANYSNDPHDPGGATMCGITHHEYDVWRTAHGLPTRNVRQITKEEGYIIYEEDYWQPHSPSLAPGLDLSYFDICVNQGPTAATHLLQATLDVDADGIWGPMTQAAVEGITNVPAAIMKLTAVREAAYRRMRNFPVFGHGWINRAIEICADSMTMTRTPAGIITLRAYVKTPRTYSGYGLKGVTVVGGDQTNGH